MFFCARKILKGRKECKRQSIYKGKIGKMWMQRGQTEGKKGCIWHKEYILPCHGGRKNLIFLFRSEETGFPDQNNEISLGAVKPVRWCLK
jgi:hypothetical protein